MRNNFLFIYLLTCLFGLFSCSTDIDVNADLEDLTVVYAAIDPNDSIHYVKINRAFLMDNVDANELAMDADNFNYPSGELTVTVNEFNDDGDVIKSHLLSRVDNEIPKGPGLFDNSTNVLYRFDEPNINVFNIYRLNIINNVLDKEITSETRIVKESTVSVNNSIAFWNGGVTSGDFTERRINIVSGDDVGRIAVSLIFNYTEHYTPESNIASVEKSIIIQLGEQAISSNSGAGVVEFLLAGETFFDRITSSVPDPINVPFFSHRELNNIVITALTAGTELNTFIEVSAPSINLNQEKPPYTNIENGLGIFSSRTSLSFTPFPNPTTLLNISPNTVTKLNSLGLGFCSLNASSTSDRCP